jgi:membrane protease YdiL (CAAX protease family)
MAGPARRDAPALAFALLYPTAMTWFYFVVMSQQGSEDNPRLRLAYTSGKALQFLFPVLYLAVVEPALLWRAPRRPVPRGLLLGIGFGLLVGGAILTLYHAVLRDSAWLAQTPGEIFTRLQQFGLTSPGGFLGMAVFYSVVHSFLEEYYWRWFVFDRLQRYLPLFAAVLVSSVGFMLHHVVLLYVYFPGQFWLLALPFALGVAVGGAFWAWLYHTWGSLSGPWLSHLLVDAALMAVGYSMLQPYWP